MRRTALALVFFLGGCFSYVASDVERVPEGEAVRVLLTQQAALRLTQQGAEGMISVDRPELSGALRRRPDGRLALLVPVRGGSIDSPQRPIAQELLLERADVLRVEQRRLDTRRTVLATAGAIGVGTAAVVLVVGGAEGDLDSSNPPGTTDARLP